MSDPNELTIRGPLRQGTSSAEINVGPAGQAGFIDVNTIGAALARVAAEGFTYATIRVSPGVYVEAGQLVVPSGVSIVGERANSCVVTCATKNVPLFKLRASASVHSLHVTGQNLTGGAAVEFTSTDDNDDPTPARLRALVGGLLITDCETGIVVAPKATGTGNVVSVLLVTESLVAAGLSTATVGTGVAVSGGGLVHISNAGTQEFGITRVPKAVSVTGTGVASDGVTAIPSKATLSDVAIRGCTVGAEIDSGGLLLMSACTIYENVTALSVAGTAGALPTSMRVYCTDIDDNTTDLDIAATPAQSPDIRIIWGAVDLSKVNNPNGTAFGTVAVSAKPGDQAVWVNNELHVGTPDNPRESVFGGGDSYTLNMVVKSNGDANDATGPFTDHSAVASSATGSTFAAFNGTAIDNTLYIGGPRKFGGIKLLMGSTASSPTIDESVMLVEYWNGSAWVDVHWMASASGAPYESYAETMLSRADSSEQIRFGMRDDIIGASGSWAAKAIDGDTLYWVRLRLVAALTTVPTVEQIKLHVDRYEVNGDGYTERFGGIVRKLPWIWGQLAQAGAGNEAPGDAELWVTNIFGVGRRLNEFNRSGTNDQVAFVTPLPPGIDTSKGVKIRLTWYGSANGTAGARAEFTFRLAISNNGSAINSNGTGLGTSAVRDLQTVSTPNVDVVANVQYTSPAVYLDVSEFNARPALGGDPDAAWLHIIRSVDPGNDNYVGSVTVVDIIAEYVEVFDGGHPNLF